MCKRGNYFIAVYDRQDNYIRDFNSIEECARYFGVTNNNISNYIFRKLYLKNNYKLFKMNDFGESDYLKSNERKR